MIGLHAVYTESSAFLFTGGKIMATGKFCSAQDLALSVVGGLDIFEMCAIKSDTQP